MTTRKPIPLSAFVDILEQEISSSKYFKKEVLEAMGCNVNYISKWKNGTIRPPTYIEIAKLANFLQRPLEIFIYGKEDIPHVKVPKKEYKAVLEAIKDISDTQLKILDKFTV